MIGHILTHDEGDRHVGGRKKPTIRASTHPDLIKSLHGYPGTTGGILLPPAPEVFDFSVGVPGLRDVLANDSLGDCTCAGALHMLEVIAELGGAPVTFTRDQAVGLYTLACGYNPADPSTDQGGDEYSVLTFLRDQGMDGKGGHAPAGFVAVDAKSSPAFLKSVLYNFGSLYFGAELEPAWESTSDGGTWDVVSAPNPNAGHCFVAVGANNNGIVIDTWGRFITITWAAIAQCDEIFAVLSHELIDQTKAQAPDGLAWDALEADFNAMASPIVPDVAPS